MSRKSGFFSDSFNSHGIQWWTDISTNWKIAFPDRFNCFSYVLANQTSNMAQWIANNILKNASSNSSNPPNSKLVDFFIISQLLKLFFLISDASSYFDDNNSQLIVWFVNKIEHEAKHHLSTVVTWNVFPWLNPIFTEKQELEYPMLSSDFTLLTCKICNKHWNSKHRRSFTVVCDITWARGLTLYIWTYSWEVME